MYEFLIANLRNCAETNSLSRYKRELMKQAADAIEELQQIAAHYEEAAKDYFKDVCYYLERVPKWIPVTERLPDAGERVLCYCRANIYEVMKMRTNGDWVYDTNHVYMHGFVTHWMPLPQPPKEEANE